MNLPFEVTQFHMHIFGITIAKCYALGWRQVMVVDDFGNLVELNWSAFAVACSN